MEDYFEMAAILRLIASCRPWFHMRSGVSGLLPPIKAVIDSSGRDLSWERKLNLNVWGVSQGLLWGQLDLIPLSEINVFWPWDAGPLAVPWCSRRIMLSET